MPEARDRMRPCSGSCGPRSFGLLRLRRVSPAAPLPASGAGLIALPSSPQSAVRLGLTESQRLRLSLDARRQGASETVAASSPVGLRVRRTWPFRPLLSSPYGYRNWRVSEAEGTLREHQPGHGRPRPITRPQSIPPSSGTSLVDVTRACPRLPPRCSMVRRESPVRVRKRALNRCKSVSFCCLI